MCAYVEHTAGRAGLQGRVARQEDGILLLEALIGLAIIGMVSISLLAATGTQVRSADKADVLLTAAALAQDRQAAIQFLDTEQFTRPPDSLLAGTFPAPFDEFTWTAEVAEMDGEYDLFVVSITVTGRGEWFPLETLVHRPPLTAQPAAGDSRGAGGGRGESGGRGTGRERSAGGERSTREMGRGSSYRSGTSRTPPPGRQSGGRPPTGGPGSTRIPPPSERGTG